MAQLENKPVLEAQLDEALSILRELKAQQIVSYERRVAESISLREETEKKLTVFKKEVAERSSAICKKTSDTRKAVMKELDVLCTEVEYFDAQQHQMIQKERAVKENIKNRRWSEDNYAIFGTGKIFYSRNSKLSELLRVSEFQTIYNIFVAVLVLFLISIMLKNHFEHGNAINFSLLIWAFGKLEYVAVVWFAMQLAVFAAFSFKHMILNDFPAPFIIALYVVFQLLFFAVPAGACLKLSLPPASGFIVMCELVRMAMKVHSFVRVMFVTKTKRDNQTKENLKVILRQKQGQERNSYEKTENNRESEDYLSNIIKSKFDYVKKEKDEHPFEHYVYFLFCPTLLYRSVYPRTPKIRWSHVVHHLLETASCTFYTYVVFERYCIPEYRKAAQEPYSFETFVLSIFSSMLPATLVMLLGFFGILHSWLNAFAEITQFADREFYSDWWNAKSFSEYYRKWNGVIYDWLHDYAYRDVVGYCTVKLQLEKQKSTFNRIISCHLDIIYCS